MLDKINKKRIMIRMIASDGERTSSSGSGAGLIAGLAGAAGGLFNFFSNRETNRANERMNQANIDFQRETNALNEKLTREAWSREDNAVARRAMDLEAAGLSKTLAAGSAASSSGAAQMDAPQYKFGHETAKSSIADVAQTALQMSQSFARNEADINKIESERKLLDAQVNDFDSQVVSRDLANRLALLDLIERGTNYSGYRTTKPNAITKILSFPARLLESIQGGLGIPEEKFKPLDRRMAYELALGWMDNGLSNTVPAVPSVPEITNSGVVRERVANKIIKRILKENGAQDYITWRDYQ